MTRVEQTPTIHEIRRLPSPDFVNRLDIGTAMATLNIDEWAIHFEAEPGIGARTFIVIENADADMADAVKHAWHRAGFDIEPTVDVEPWHPTHVIVGRESDESRPGVGFVANQQATTGVKRRVLSGSKGVTNRLLAIASQQSSGAFAVRISIGRPGETIPGEIATGYSNPEQHPADRFACDLRIELDLAQASLMTPTT